MICKPKHIDNTHMTTIMTFIIWLINLHLDYIGIFELINLYYNTKVKEIEEDVQLLNDSFIKFKNGAWV